MKKWLTASAICLIGVFFMGICVPVLAWFKVDGGVKIKPGATNVYILYVTILIVCISIILVTTLMMFGHASEIDRLDKRESELDQRSDRLEGLIGHYNKLIVDAEGSNRS